MNALEHYIKEVLSVDECNDDWTKKFPDRRFVKIRVITECYGVVEERETVENVADWVKIRERGYFMW